MRRTSSWTGFGRVLGLLPLFAAAAGCELTEVVTEEAEDAVVAEIYVYIDGNEVTARALLHRTFTQNQAPPAAEIVISRPADGRTARLSADAPEACTFGLQPDRIVGSCYTAGGDEIGWVRPGDILEVRADLGPDGSLRGRTTTPADFTVVQPAEFGGDGVPTCRIEPLTNIQFRWTSAEGTWAYLTETLIQGLDEISGDSTVANLVLTGLALSAADTTILYPANYGVFDRFDLDQEVSRLLQQGLPGGTEAQVEILAADRNATNWNRQGAFNPSGLIRIPSLQGEGTGVFSAGVVYGFRVVAATAGSPEALDENGVEFPSCGPPIDPSNPPS
jgi:hypothetical protein